MGGVKKKKRRRERLSYSLAADPFPRNTNPKRRDSGEGAVRRKQIPGGEIIESEENQKGRHNTKSHSRGKQAHDGSKTRQLSRAENGRERGTGGRKRNMARRKASFLLGHPSRWVSLFYKSIDCGLLEKKARQGERLCF